MTNKERRDALEAELNGSHPGTFIAYSGDFTEAAVQINEVNRTEVVSVSSADMLSWSGENNRYHRMRFASTNHANDTVKTVASVAIAMMGRDNAELDLKLSDRNGMLNALVTAAVLDADDETSLRALATKPVSRAVELGLGLVRPGDVIWARNNPS